MNIVSLIGRTTKDPEVRWANDLAIARFSVAIDRYVKNKEKETDFINIVVFGKQAENCEKWLHKGKLVGIQGHIQTGSYTNKDNKKVYTTDVVADRVEFLEWGDKKDSTSSNKDNADDVPDGFEAIDEEELPF